MASDTLTPRPPGSKWEGWSLTETLNELGELCFDVILTGRVGTLCFRRRDNGRSVTAETPLESRSAEAPCYALERRLAAMRLLAPKAAAAAWPGLVEERNPETGVYSMVQEPEENPDIAREALRAPRTWVNSTAAVEDAMDREQLLALKEASLVLLAARSVLAVALDDLPGDPEAQPIHRPQALGQLKAIFDLGGLYTYEDRWAQAVEKARTIVQQIHKLPENPPGPPRANRHEQARAAWQLIPALGLTRESAERARRLGLERRRIIESDPQMRGQLSDENELLAYMDTILLGLMPPWDRSSDPEQDVKNLVSDLCFQRRELLGRLLANWTPRPSALRSNGLH